jgi:hypothetical protein
LKNPKDEGEATEKDAEGMWRMLESSIGEYRGHEKVTIEDVEDIIILHSNTVLNSCG